MKALMKRITVMAAVLSVVFAVMNTSFGGGLWLSPMITALTVTYHFTMRLAVGGIVDKVMNNQADCTRKWFQVSAAELRFYDLLRVKQWKGRMPTYEPDLFSPEKHSWSEIAQAMCQAEVVHEIIVLFSFLPIMMTKWWGSFGVFLTTSVSAALLDLSFVIMQRYNRPRVLRLAERSRRLSERNRTKTESDQPLSV